MRDSPEPDRSRPGFHNSHWPVGLLVVFALVLAAGLFCLGINRRATTAWKRYRADIAARGESLDWKDNLPPPEPPEAENFGATPLLRAVGRKGKVDPIVWGRIAGVGLSAQLGNTGNWMAGLPADLKAIQLSLRGAGVTLPPLPQEPGADVLAVLAALDEDLDELREASKRPYAKLNLAYPEPLSADIPNFVALRNLSQICSLRASADLSLGRNDEAFADIRVIHRLADVTRAEPFLVSAMIHCAIHGLALQTFWEGWVSDHWSVRQLEEFQKEFAAVDLLAAYDRAMRGERAGVNYMIETLSGRELVRRLSGGGATASGNWKEWLTQFAVQLSPRALRSENLLNYNLLLDATTFRNYDLRRQQIFPAKCDAAMTRLDNTFSKSTLQNYLAMVALPNFSRALQTVARNQTLVNEALVVCALERYRRAIGEYPATLAALRPRFLDKLPHDVVTGNSLKYRRTADGRFLVYSVGWNEKDDQGEADKGEKGDWVWPVAIKN